MLTELAKTCSRLLDGRSDLANTGTVFNPPWDRYKSEGDGSAVIMRLKIELIAIFKSITHLRTNYRLAQLLANFRSKEALIGSEVELLFRRQASERLLGTPSLKSSAGHSLRLLFFVTCSIFLLFHILFTFKPQNCSLILFS